MQESGISGEGLTTTVQQTASVPIDFNMALMGGLSPGNIKLMSLNTGREVVYGDFDKAAKASGLWDKYQADPDSYNTALEQSKKMWDFYGRGDELASTVTFSVIPNDPYAKSIARLFGISGAVMPEELAVQKVETPKMWQYISGGIMQTMTEDNIASSVGFFRGNSKHDYAWIPMNSTNLAFTNNLYWKTGDKELPLEYFWQEAEDYEIIPANKIRTVFGDRNLRTPTVFNSFGRGVVGGFLGDTLAGVGELINTAGDLVTKGVRNYALWLLKQYTGVGLSEIMKDKNVQEMVKQKHLEWILSDEDKYQTKWTDLIGGALINAGHRVTKTNLDEQGSYDTWNSWMFQFGKGVGQIGSMVATGYIVGGALAVSSKAGSMLGRLAGGLSREAMLVVGSSQSMQAFKDEMRTMGVSDVESAPWAILFGVATYLSERMIGPNLLTNFWGQGNRAIAKKLTGEISKNAMRATGKTIAGMSEGSKRFFSKKIWQTYLKSGEALRELAYKSRAAGAAITGGEEFLEEIGEDVMDTMTQYTYNGWAKRRAEDIRDEYSNVTYKIEKQPGYPVAEKIWRIRNGDEYEEIDRDTYEAELREQQFAEKVESGEGLWKPGIDLASDSMVFWSAALFGAFAKNIHRQSKFQKKNLIEIARKVANNEMELKTIYTEWEKMKDEGLFGRTDVDDIGNPIVYGSDAKSRADVTLDALKTKLDFYVNIVRSTGINTAMALAGAEGNDFIVDETIELYEKNIEHQKQIAEIDAMPAADINETLKKEKKEALLSRIAENQSKIDYNIKPAKLYAPKITVTNPDGTVTETDNPLYHPEGEKSNRFKEEYLKIMMLDAVLDDKAYDYARQMLTQKNKRTPTEQEIQAIIPSVKSFLIAEGFFNKFRDTKFYDVFNSIRDIHTSVTESYISNKIAESKAVYEGVSGGLESSMSALQGLMVSLQSAVTSEDRNTIASAFAMSPDRVVAVRRIFNDLGNIIASEDQQRMLTAQEKMNLVRSAKAYNNALTTITGMVSGAASQTLTDMYAGISDFGNMDIEERAKAGLAPGYTADQLTEAMRSADSHIPLTPASLSGKQRMDILDRIFENLPSEGKPAEGGYMLGEFMRMGKSFINNPDIEIPHAESFKVALDKFQKVVKSLEHYIYLNKKYFQDKLESDRSKRQFSLLYNKTNERLNDEEVVRFGELTREYVNDLEKVRELLKMKRLDTETYQHTVRVSLLHNMFLLFEDVMDRTKNYGEKENFIDEDTLDTLNKAMDDVMTVLKPYEESREYRIAASVSSPKVGLEELLKRYNVPVRDKDNNIDSEATRNNKEKIEKVTDAIEKIMGNTIVKLSGKLDAVIADFNAKIKNMGHGYSRNTEFEGEQVIEKKKEAEKDTAFSGVLSYYEQGRSNVLAVQKDPGGTEKVNSKGEFYYWYFLTMLNMINRYGQNGTASYAEVHKAYTDFVAGSKDTLIDVPTGEQKMAVMHAVGFVLNNRYLYDDEDVFDGLTPDDRMGLVRMPNVLMARGAAGTGKTTSFVQHIIAVLSQLNKGGRFTNKAGDRTGKIRVLTVTKTDSLAAYHRGMLIDFAMEKLGNLLEHSTVTFEEIGKGNVDTSKYDIIFFDEGSAYGQNEISLIKDITGAKNAPRGIVLFDSGQMFENERATQMPVMSAGERTMPISYVFRTGIVYLQNLSAAIDRMNSKDVTAAEIESGVIYPDGKWIDHPEYGLAGLRYVTTEGEVMRDFKDEVDAHPDDSIYLLVENQTQKNSILTKFAADEKKYRDRVKTVDEKAGEQFSKAFVIVDFDSYGANNTFAKARFMRSALTRQKIFLEFIVPKDFADKTTQGVDEADVVGLAQTAAKVYGTMTEEEVARDTKDKQALRDSETIRLVRQQPDMEVIPPPPPVSDIYDHDLTEDEAVAIAKSEQVKQATRVFGKRTIRKEAQEPGHVTAEERLTDLLTQTEKSNIRKAANELYGYVLRAAVEGRADTDISEEVRRLVENYKNAISNYNKGKPESERWKEIADTPELMEGLVYSLIKLFATDPYFSKTINADKLFIKNPQLRGKKINGDAIQGNPYLLKIVGIDGKGNIIADIIDFSFVEESKKELTAYDLAKAGMYISLLSGTTIKVNKEEKGVIVNNYRNIPVTISKKDHLSIETGRELVMSPEQKADALITASSAVDIKQVKSLTEEQYYNNERIVPDERVMMNSVYSDADEKTVAVSYVVRNRAGKRVLITTREGAELYVPYDDFVRDYDLFRPHTMKIHRALYNSAALEHSKYNTAYSSSAVLFGMQQKYISDNYYVYDETGKRMTNPVYALRHLMLFTSPAFFNVGYAEKEVIYEYDHKVKGYVLNESSRHVITLSMPDMKSVLITLNGLDKSTKEGMLWNDTRNILFKGMTDEQILSKVMNEKLDVVSVVFLPEEGFDKKVSADVIDELLTKPGERDALDFINSYMDMPERFSDDESQASREKLIDYNKARMLFLWRAAKGLVKTANVTPYAAANEDRAGIISGTVLSLAGEGGLSYADFKNRNEKRGNMTVGVPKAMTDFGGRHHQVYVRVQRKGMAPKPVRFWARRIVSPDEEYLKTMLAAEYRTAEDILKKGEDMFVGADGKKRVPSGKDMHELLGMLENSLFYKFLVSNMGSALFDEKGILGGFFERKQGSLDIRGRMLREKLTNFRRGVEALKNWVNTEYGNVVEGRGPYAGSFLYRNIYSDFKNRVVNEDNIVTYSETIGQPQIRFSTDIQSGIFRTGDDKSDMELSMAVEQEDDSVILQPLEAASAVLEAMIGDAVRISNVEDITGTAWIRNSNGSLVWGLLRDGLISLSSVNGMVEKRAVKHEAMHFIMMYMLKPEAFNTVMDDIQKKLGDTWDGTTEHLYEHAAEVFQGEEIKVPKNIFERFIRFLQKLYKRVLMYLDIYKPTLESLVADVKAGVFVNAPVYTESEVYELAMEKRKNRYNNLRALQKLAGTFGSLDMADNVMRNYIYPKLRDYSHIGGLITVVNAGWGEAIKDTIDYYKQFANVSSATPVSINVSVIKEDGVPVIVPFTRTGNDGTEGIATTVYDMTVDDFLTAYRYRDLAGHNTALDNYIKYQLSSLKDDNTGVVLKSDYIIKILLQRLFPSRNIDAIISEGVKARSEAKHNFALAAVKVDTKKSMTDSMKMVIEGIRLRNEAGNLTRYKAYIPFNIMNGILIEAAGTAKREGMPGNFRSIMTVLKRYLNDPVIGNVANSSFVSYVRSFLYELGDYATGSVELRKVSDVIVERGNLKKISLREIRGYGMQGMIDNADAYLRIAGEMFPDNAAAVRTYRNLIRTRIRNYRTFLNGLAAHYFSPTTTPITRAYSDGFFTRLYSRSADNETVMKQNLADTVRYGFLNNGIVKDSKAGMLDEKKGTWWVDDDGLYRIVDGSKVKIVDGKNFVYDRKNIPVYQELLHYFGLTGINAGIMEGIGRMYKGQTKDNFLAKNLYYMLLSARLNIAMSGNAKSEDADNPDDTAWTYSINDEEQGLLDKLNAFYSANDYIFESIDAKMGRGQVSVTQLALPSPDDMWRFYEVLGRAMKYNRQQLYSGMERNVEGEWQYRHNPGSTFTDTVGLGSAFMVKQTAGDLVKRMTLRNRTAELQKKFTDNTITADETVEYNRLLATGENVISPLFTDERGLRNNAVLTGKLGFAPYENFNGIENPYLGIPFDRMTPYDMLLSLFGGVYYEMQSRGKKFTAMPVYYDTQADKPTKYMSYTWFQGKHGERQPFAFPVLKKVRRGMELETVEINEPAFADIVDDIIGYYDTRQALSLERWQDMGRIIGKEFGSVDDVAALLSAPVDETVLHSIHSNLRVNEDYIEHKGKLYPGNSLMLKFVMKDNDRMIYGREFIDGWKKLTTAKEKYGYFIKAIDDAYTDFIAFMEEQGFHPAMVKRMAEGEILPEGKAVMLPAVSLKEIALDFPEIEITTFSQLREYKNNFYRSVAEKIRSVEEDIYASETLTAEEKKKSYSEYEKLKTRYFDNADKVFRDLYRKINPSLYDNPLARVIFLTFHVFNESVSQIARGGAANYSDIIDYIKRAAGLQAPGEAFITYEPEENTYGLRRRGRMVVMKDIGAYNPALSSKRSDKAHTDGLVFLNPVTHILAKLSSGDADGNVTDNILKWVNNGYDILSDNVKYLKASFVPVDKDSFEDGRLHRTMFEMMLGPEVLAIFNKYYTMSEVAGDYYAALDFTAHEVVEKDLQYTMVDLVAHASAVKTGQEKIAEYTVPEGQVLTPFNATVSPALNSPAASAVIDMGRMRIQRATIQDTVNPVHPLLVQFSRLLGMGRHNADLVAQMNSTLAFFVDYHTSKLAGLKTKKAILNYIKSIARKSILTAKETGILASDIMDPDIGIEIYRRKAVSVLLSNAERFTKPQTPGIETIQTPSHINYHFFDDEPGILYRAKDLRDIFGYAAADDSAVIEGMTARPLRPVSVFSTDDNTYYTDKEKLLQDIGKRGMVIAPAEVIIKFPYMKEFGLNPDMTLAEAMLLNVRGTRVSMYETGEKRAVDGVKTYKQWLGQLYTLFTDMEYDEIVNSLPANENLRYAIRFWRTRTKMEGAGPADNRDHLITNIAAYYKSFNDSLDVIAVKIPNSLVSTITYGRVVAFNNNLENTIITSAEKSLIDGTDYDIDSLQTIFNTSMTYPDDMFKDRVTSEMIRYAIDDEAETEEADAYETAEEKMTIATAQRKLFGIFRAYFDNPLNLKYLLQETTVDNIVNAADARYGKTTEFVNTLGTMLSTTQDNNLGKDILGHFVAAESAFLDIAHIPLKKKQLAVRAGLIYKGGTVFLNDDLFSQAITIIGEMEEGSADNAKYGGIIGKLNINPVTSPLITGLIAFGYKQDQIYNAVSDNEALKEAVRLALSSYNINAPTRMNKGRRRNVRIWNVLDDVLDDYEAIYRDDPKNPEIVRIREDISFWKTASYMGEQIRKLADIIRIQQKVGASDWDFVQLKRTVVSALGMPINIFLDNINTIRDKGTAELRKSYQADPEQQEMSEVLDLGWVIANHELLSSYIRLVSQLDNTVKNGFLVYQHFREDNPNDIMKLTARDSWESEAHFLSYINAIEKHIQGKFLRQTEPVILRFTNAYGADVEYVFDLAKTQDKVLFGLMVPDWLRSVKSKYGMLSSNFMTAEGQRQSEYSRWRFFDRLNIMRDSRGFEYVEFTNSFYLDEAAKTQYRNYFNGLSDEEKNILQLYQLLFYGALTINGNMNEIMDNPYKKGLSAFMDRYIVDDDNLPLAEEIIFTENLGNTNTNDKEAKYFTQTVRGVKHTYRLNDDGTKTYLFNNLWTSVNTYGNLDQISDVPSVPPTGTDAVLDINYTGYADVKSRVVKIRYDRAARKNIRIRTNGWTGIYSAARGNIQPWQIRDDGVGELVDGTRVTVHLNPDNNTSFNITRADEQKAGIKKINKKDLSQRVVFEKGRPKTTDLYSALIAAETSVLSNMTLDVFAERFSHAFPNIRIVKTFDEDPSNLYPDRKAYIYNGVVYINTDKITADTLLHEYGHIFILAVRHSDVALYRELMMSVKDFIGLYPDIAAAIRSQYADIDDAGFRDEVAAFLLGFGSVESIRSQLHGLRIMNTENKARTISERFTGIIRKILDFIRRITEGLFGMKLNAFRFDFETGTILDLGLALHNAVVKGDVITSISTDDVMKLQYIHDSTNLAQAAMAQPLSSADTFKNKLMNKYNHKRYKDMNDEEKMEYLIRMIYDNDMVLPAGVIGARRSFADMTEAQIRDTILANNYLNIVNTYLRDRNNSLIKFLNEKKGSLANIADLGVNEGNVPVYHTETFSRFLYQIDYNPRFKLYTLADAARNIPGFKYNSFFNDMEGVIVAQEHTDDEQTILSLYVVDTKPQILREEGVAKDNILSVYDVDNRRARHMKLGLHNDERSVNNVLLALLAGEVMNNNRKLRVRVTGAVGLMPSDNSYEFIHYGVIMRAVRLMGNNSDFLRDVPDSMKDYFTGRKTIPDLDINFDKVFYSLLDDLKDRDSFKYKARYAMDGYMEASISQKKRYVSWVLRELQKNPVKNSGDLWLERILTKTLSTLGRFKVANQYMNYGEDVDHLKLWITSIVDIGEENVALMSKVHRTTAMKGVNTVNEFKKDFEPVLKWFKEKGYSGYKNNYDLLWVKIPLKDHTGKVSDRDIGWIYWTKDIREDPHFGAKAKELGLSDEMLEKGRWLVDRITNQLVEAIYHHLETTTNMYNPETKKEYTKEDARKLLFERYKYKKGMMPLMNKTFMELVMGGDLGKAANKKVLQASDMYTIYDETAGTSEGTRLDTIDDMFFGQLLGQHTTRYGTTGRLSGMLGIVYNNGEYSIPDERMLKINENLSHDIETIMNYFMMSSIRKINYENEVLPVLNGIRHELEDMRLNKGKRTADRTIKYLEMYSDRAITAVAGKYKLGQGQLNIAPLIQTTSSTLGYMVLMGNINVGVLSASINAIRAWTEALANGWDSPNFSPSDLLEASAKFWTDIAKASQLVYDMQLCNMSEYEVITGRMHRVTRKDITDQQIINWTNWSTDFYARAVTMIAQMIHDGAWDAYVWDGKTGRVKYDFTKDAHWKDLKDNKAKQFEFKTRREHLINEGRQSEENEGLASRYLFEEINVIKWLSDKIVGGYTTDVKNNMSNVLLGRLFNQFKNYMTRAATDAFHPGSWLDDAGRLIIKQGWNGDYVAEWERIWVEGYLTTIFKDVMGLIGKGGYKETLRPTDARMKNYRKLIGRAVMFALLYLLYNGLVDRDRDRSDDDKPIKDNRLIRNARYIADSIFIIPQIVEFIQTPFATISILDRWFGYRFGRWQNLKAENFIPSQVTTVTELFEEEE